jgi:hypothetical protein
VSDRIIVRVPSAPAVVTVRVPATPAKVVVSAGRKGDKGDKGDPGDGGMGTVAGTGWVHVTVGTVDASASTPTAVDVGADAVGSSAAVQGNLTAHASANGAAVHGLGSAAIRADTDFDTAGAATAALASANAFTTSSVAGKADAATVTPGTYTKPTVNAQGIVTAGAQATKSDVGLSNVPNTDFTAEVTRSKLALYTGVLSGCTLSINGSDPTKLDIIGGFTQYEDNSDPFNPISETLTVAPATVAPLVAGQGLDVLFKMWCGIARQSAGVGVLVFSASMFTDAERRRIAVLGTPWATAIGSDTIAAVSNYPAPAWGAAKTLEDLFYALGGSLNIDGNDFTAHAGQLTLDKSAGHATRLYGAASISKDAPNNPTASAAAPVTAYRYWAAAGSSYGNALHATLDPNYYDNAGTRTAVTAGKWTIQRVYWFPSTSPTPVVAVTYGQAMFDSLELARAAADTQFLTFSTMTTGALFSGLLRARVYVQQGATDLSGAYVERMTQFVGGGAGGGGGTVGDHATLINLAYATSGHTGFTPATRKITATIDLSADRNLTYADVGADAAGSAATVLGVLSTHAGLATTAHGGIVASNGAITPATSTKVTYDAKGLVTGGVSATTADIADSTDKRYCTDAQKVVIGNTSGTNTGNETGATIRTALGITTLSGSNTGDQTLPTDATISTTDVTTNNAGTTKHGWSPKVTAPAANQLVVVAIANGETVVTGKTLIGTTSPSTQAFADAASHGTSVEAAAADHKHAMPAAPTASSVGLGNVANLDTSTTTNITDATDKRFCTDAQKTVLGNTSGTNTGDQTLPTDATIATTDVTTNNVSTGKHGWAPKLPGNATTYLRGDGTWATPAGGTGGAAPATGTAIIDFGAAPGSQSASVTVAGQADIVAGSFVRAHIQATDSTATHNADEHLLLSRLVTVSCTAITAAASFTITAQSELTITGTISVRWEWI